MKKMKKAGLLLLMLAVPALLFLFLKKTAVNHYTIPKYYPLIDSANGNVMGEYRLEGSEKVFDTLYHTIPDFRLVGQNGATVERGYLKGKVFVSDFFFTRCPGICKKMTSQMTRVQERFGNTDDFRIVSFSVDYEYDGVPELKKYAEMNGIDARKWLLLGGDGKQIYRLAKQGFFVTAKEDDLNAKDLESRFVHTDKFVLVDKLGRIRGYYNGTDRKEVDRLMTEIDILLLEN